MQHPELMEKSCLQEGTGKARGGEKLRWSHTSKSKLLRMTLLAFCCVWVSSQHLQQQRALGWPEATSHTPQRDPDGLALPDVAPIPSQPHGAARASGAALPLARGCQQFADCLSQPGVGKKDVYVTLGKRQAQQDCPGIRGQLRELVELWQPRQPRISALNSQ